MTKSTIALYIALASFICNADASEVATSQQYSDCQDWPETSTMYQGCVMNHQTEAMQIQVEVLQKQILEYAEPAARKQLQRSVNAWKNYVKQTCQLQEAVMGGINGFSSASCYNSLTRQRLEYLQDNF